MFNRFVPDPTGEAGSPQRPVTPCDCDRIRWRDSRNSSWTMLKASVPLVAATPPLARSSCRLHGVAHGTFAICPDLPADLRVGVFGQRAEYPVWVRFSGDIQPGAPDVKGTAGIGIKLFGVDGEKLLVPDQDATTHDFLLQNHDVFFVDTAKDMCEFTCLSLNGQVRRVRRRPTRSPGRSSNDMEKVVDSVLGTPYWSGLPRGSATTRYVKYKLEPEVVPGGTTSPITATRSISGAI